MATTRTAGITAAAGTSLAQSLFLYLFRVKKSCSKKNSTSDSFLILADIGKFPRLLHSIELGIVSKIPSQGTPVKGPYRSLACCSSYLNNYLIGRSLILRLCISKKAHSSGFFLLIVSLSFPKLLSIIG